MKGHKNIAPAESRVGIKLFDTMLRTLAERSNTTPLELVNNLQVQNISYQDFENANNNSSNQLKPSSVRVVETPNFKKWFGDSKLVDESGEPRVMYHGSGSDIKIFKHTKAGGIFWFTPNKKIAEGYAVDRSNIDTSENAIQQMTDDEFNDMKQNINSTITMGYLSARNPLDLTTKEGMKVIASLSPDSSDNVLLNQIIKSAKENNFLYFWRHTTLERFNHVWENTIIPQLKKSGYDSIKMNDDAMSGIVFGVFNSNQIKSVDNNGDFDVKNPNIMFQDNDSKRGAMSRVKYW